jgi:hypothetical protein
MRIDISISIVVGEEIVFNPKNIVAHSHVKKMANKWFFDHA